MGKHQRIELHSVVRLKKNIPEEDLVAGAIGTVVAIFKHPEQAYEIEFTDDEGRTITQLPLRADEVDVVP